MDHIRNRATGEGPPLLKLLNSDRVWSPVGRKDDRWARGGAAARAWVLNYQAERISATGLPSKPAA